MKIIYDIGTGEIIRHTGINTIYPEGIPDEQLNLNSNEATFSLHDINDKEKVQAVLNAKEYELVFDENGNPIDVNIIQTMEEYLTTIPPTKEEINAQVVAKIREVYDINKEFEMQRRGLQDPNDSEYLAYLQYVNDCLAWGDSEKQKYGY